MCADWLMVQIKMSYAKSETILRETSILNKIFYSQFFIVICILLTLLHSMTLQFCHPGYR